MNSCQVLPNGIGSGAPLRNIEFHFPYLRFAARTSGEGERHMHGQNDRKPLRAARNCRMRAAADAKSPLCRQRQSPLSENRAARNPACRLPWRSLHYIGHAESDVLAVGRIVLVFVKRSILPKGRRELYIGIVVYEHSSAPYVSVVYVCG